jgi:hypothetical protein
MPGCRCAGRAPCCRPCLGYFVDRVWRDWMQARARLGEGVWQRWAAVRGRLIWRSIRPGVAHKGGLPPLRSSQRGPRGLRDRHSLPVARAQQLLPVRGIYAHISGSGSGSGGSSSCGGTPSCPASPAHPSLPSPCSSCESTLQTAGTTGCKGQRQEVWMSTCRGRSGLPCDGSTK